MTKIELVAHNFWTQAGNCNIYDHSTGLPELIDLLIKDNEDYFIEAIERLGYTVTQD